MIRQSSSGATRNDNKGKLEWIRFNDPRVEKIYAFFMNKHRYLKDGTVREPDNWKKGFERGWTLDSGGRHFLDRWEMEVYGFAVRPDEDEVNEIETICAEIFNAKARLYELLKDNESYKKAVEYFKV